MQRLLIANRGEIAVRIARAAMDLGIATVAIYSEDDANGLHLRIADEAVPLGGCGVRAYLDIEDVVAKAAGANCDAIHPGYGFLAENAGFAAACAEAGITFVGPRPEVLELFGDKGRARTAAGAADVPVLRGTDHATTVDEARKFFAALDDGGAMIIKALAGGGGRGARIVTQAGDIEQAYERCGSEAERAFGNGGLYVEELIPRARHIEVQLLGDEVGGLIDFGERECSAQRRHQKVVETAPAPNLESAVRQAIIDAALRLGGAAKYNSLGTFEFLVDAGDGAGGDNGSPHEERGGRFAFIETNARLQVEHTVTEAVTGVDLVQAQLQVARGESLADLGLDDPDARRTRGFAIQARVNLETLDAAGNVRPSSGVLAAYEPPSGPGVRIDGCGYAGYEPNPAFDSLLAKVIAHSPSDDFAAAVKRASRALDEFRIGGPSTNIPWLQSVLAHPDFEAGRLYTRWLDDNAGELAAAAGNGRRPRFVPAAGPGASGEAASTESSARDSGFAGARVDTADPLALFAYDQETKAAQAEPTGDGSDLPASALSAEGATGIAAPIQGTIVSIDVAEGEEVLRGQQMAVIEAMKMEHVLRSDTSGTVLRVTMAVGDTIREGYPLVLVEGAEGGEAADAAVEIDPDYIRPDLEENIRRHDYTLDENRPEAVARRRRFGFRTPRENIEQLVDSGSFKEYWPLIVARQHQKFSDEKLRQYTPADGVVAGTASINGDLFDDERSRAMVLSYDYTVLAGTQGGRNHYKQDRLFDLANRYMLPLVFFTEGGGGRPGDDYTGPRVAFDTYTFTQFSKLSGLIPLVGVNNGRCFAGNTALLACCDVIIATKASTIAMGGPAMIEGGGLGIYTPEEVGPMSFQVPNGVVDILVEDEEEAVDVAKKYLSYFQGPISDWEAHDQRPLRHVVPENRLRLYDMQEIVHTIADVGSVLEIRPKFGIGVITALIRVEGRPMGVIANNPHHLAGAIDSDGSDKGARFLQLCDAFDIPVLSLMDCPGIMVGPDHEKTALVRHCARMFNTGANLSVPLFGVVVRKAYGLGVQAMCGASALVGFFTVGWPTAEFAGMNIEGAVKLGYRKELAAIEDPEERRLEFERRVEASYERAKAVNAATGGGLDDVIDPAETRSWITESMKRLPKPPPRTGKKRPYIDTW
ncbi:MAG: carbamoyl-phosphate synthase large subunit [Holophagales bacterium]|nr:carbamoyl-phosphate synthase large subunit [Holophagales bacterium]MYC08589.1 carbamoyl-phosphate synthase large subunit [Holophagales bacterium]